MLSKNNNERNDEVMFASKWVYSSGKGAAYLSEIKSLRGYIVSIPFVLLASYLFYNTASGDNIILWGKEDSFFEWLTALFYFAAALLLVITYRANKNIYLLLLAVVLFFGAGEEISWGQRIFGFATPEEINRINVQHEFNIHNMILFDGKTMDGGVKRGIARFFEMDLLFKLFTICWGIALPFFVYQFKPVAAFSQKLKVPVPPISIGVFFLLSWIILKLSLSAFPALPASSSTNEIKHYWRVYMAGPEIQEFIGAYIMAVICLYFFNNRHLNIMGKDVKQIKTFSSI